LWDEDGNQNVFKLLIGQFKISPADVTCKRYPGEPEKLERPLL
jgi:hypothetical protein